MNIRSKIAKLMDAYNLDQLIVYGFGDTIYTSGYKSCMDGVTTMHILDRDENEDKLFVLHRFELDMSSKVYPLEKSESTYSYPESVQRVLKNGSRIGITSKSIMPYDLYNAILEKCPNPIDLSQEFRELRFVKTTDEIHKLEVASSITEAAMAESYKKIKPGVTEAEIGAYFEYAGKKRGCGLAFTSSVAFGENTRFVAHLASETKIKPGDMIFFDVGLKYENYCADIGRTLVLGKPNELMKERYKQMLEVFESVIAMVKPGLQATKLHKKVMEGYTKYNLGEMRHRIGHGCGIETSTEGIDLMLHDHLVLQPNMCICIETSMNQNDEWGIKIEDVILVTEIGYRLLSTSSKELICL